MNIKAWMLSLSICMAWTTTHAEVNLDWQYIDQSPEYRFFIKPATVQQVTDKGFSQYRQVWGRAVVNNANNPEGLAEGDYMATLFWVDCAQKTTGVSKGLFFSKTGKPMLNLNFTEQKVQMEPAQAGSVNDKILQQTCAVAL